MICAKWDKQSKMCCVLSTKVKKELRKWQEMWPVKVFTSASLGRHRKSGVPLGKAAQVEVNQQRLKYAIVQENLMW